MVSKYEKLIRDFGYLPKSNTDPTFMEICHMGGDRFEERCSQILQFYLSPLAPHKLRGLFLDSLLELLQMEVPYTIQNVKVITEELAVDRKRIDILIMADDFVIAIENKIFAEVYNPLESYTTHIHQTYKDKSIKKFVLLSVKKITQTDELNKLADNGYIYVNYADLFRVIKDNLGRYIMDCDQGYLTFMFDFMRTIEKKYLNSNMELKQFFFNNRQSVEELISQYDAFKKEIFSNQCEYISRIQREVSEKTGANWRIWEGWDLLISFNDDSKCIGIECSFRDENFSNQIGNFHMYITTWKRDDFRPYDAELRRFFGDAIDYHSVPNRVYLHLPVIVGPIDDGKIAEIVDALAKYYTQLKEITDRIKE